MTDMPLSATLLERFIAIVGPTNALTDQADITPYLTENRGLYHGASPLVLKPGSTEEVSKILALASETKSPIVPVSGGTGLVGGQVPRDNSSDILLSLERMNTVREVDPVGNVIVADAGCILADIQKAAADVNRLFPLSLGSEGSCRIGGNLATNAGGTAVLVYGNMRQLCLGLEVVLPTGEIWNGLRRLKKDNSGYDLRDLFIGAEGTLGVITGAVLKLYPQPLGHEVGFVGLKSPVEALALFEKASALCGPALTGFELMPRIGVDFTSRHIPNVRDPLASVHDWYVLVDIATSDAVETARTMMHDVLEQGVEAGLIEDAVVAGSVAQQKALWHMRESMSDAQKPEGGSIKHDVSVPIAQVPAFMRQAEEAVLAAMPGARVCAFGHLGDGNIHYNISQPIGADKAQFIGRWREINKVVHDIVRAHGGSISAEHGVGQLKRAELAQTRPDIETVLMIRIKQAFDPAGIMNPGKVVPG
ncbi:FAD-binding oxidoreductase [Agrobacterium vitis]|uniref:FAD-binding oxidoreductase n=1 Tax=Agrobacterium vitis TaxID=373 RepID=UPI000872DC9B|nr:FAD-binding oxidoreductase [Agrobacterium vitis]MCE6074873.1 FAD-binding protein [Agrobacterium vitis]MCM2467722.1 FAD-binding oxidoreductase [Agrobacterium vitis]MUO68373.1 FAD-binding protein [Agrobacterium vitis]MUO83409.1 FAD-binding protein [Agrobacterium vitis]MVA34915.1 FAD-binding protein [Agrobacterium vitis]